MPGQKVLIFNPSNLYNLLVHATDGECPLRGEVRDVLVHPSLQRMVALNVSSDEWETDEPLQLRYEGQRTISWTKGKDSDPEWRQRAETPTRQ